MSVIAGQGGRTYVAIMAAMLFRLLALAALVVMPLGMAGAPAMAQQMPMDHAAMAGGHCDEQPGQDKAPASKMDCAAMCTALPAGDGPAPAARMRLSAPRTIAIVALFAGIEPEIATPPPRQG